MIIVRIMVARITAVLTSGQLVKGSWVKNLKEISYQEIL